MLDRCVFPFLDAVVPLSEELYQPLKRLPGMKSKLHLILNGVDIAEVTESDNVSKDVQSGKRDGAFIIGYIGQLIPRKGLDVLLQALSELNDLNWELFLVGEGEQKEELKVIAQELGIHEKVKFVGYREERLEYLRGFDVFVLPSKLEGIPRCLMEAMAAKVPIIATDIPGCNDLLLHNLTGLLFPPGKPVELIKCLRRFVEDPRLGKRLINEAYREVSERYSSDRMAEEYMDFYSEILKQGVELNASK
jgi:glycosyltransferase involved in cell wall biosynthesis